MFLAGLLFGRTIGWIGQTRDDHAVPWCGGGAPASGRRRCSGLASRAALPPPHPSAIPYALFIAGGLAVPIPLAVGSTPRPAVPLSRAGIGRLPEETAPPPPCARSRLPAIELTLAQTAQATARSA